MTRELTFLEAVREAQVEEMRRDDDVLIMGEDLRARHGLCPRQRRAQPRARAHALTPAPRIVVMAGLVPAIHARPFYLPLLSRG